MDLTVKLACALPLLALLTVNLSYQVITWRHRRALLDAQLAKALLDLEKARCPK